MTHSALQLGLGLAGTLAGIGFLAGIGLVWSARGAEYTYEVISRTPREEIISS